MSSSQFFLSYRVDILSLIILSLIPTPHFRSLSTQQTGRFRETVNKAFTVSFDCWRSSTWTSRTGCCRRKKLLVESDSLTVNFRISTFESKLLQLLVEPHFPEAFPFFSFSHFPLFPIFYLIHYSSDFGA